MTHGYFRRFCDPRLVTIEYRVSTDFCPPSLRKPSIFLSYTLRDERRPAFVDEYIFKKEREKRYRARVIVTVNRWILFVQDNRARLDETV